MSNGNNSKAPLIIIGVVLVAVLAGVWFLMNRSSTSSRTVSNANRPANAARTPMNPPEMGATPPNFLGSANASVVVEEFADFQCPTCAAKHPMMKEIVSIYGSRIKFVFRQYPLAIAAHDKAYDAAVASEAAGLQGKFWEMQNLLFTNQQAWSASPDYRKIWEGYASQIGLDVERLKSDMAGLSAKSRVDADMKRGRALNISSTPSLFVNGMAVPFEQMTTEGVRKIIDDELAKAPTNNQSSTTNSPTNPANTEQKK